jgi:hypothetical protein
MNAAGFDDPIVLRQPGGTERTERIAGLEFVHPNPGRQVNILITGLRKADVPIGTEVWSVD